MAISDISYFFSDFFVSQFFDFLILPDSPREVFGGNISYSTWAFMDSGWI